MTVSPDLNISKQAGPGILSGKVFPGMKSTSKGTYTVEFAIVAAALFLLMLAILDVAILCFVNLTMQNAVREGARYAITGRSDLDPQNEGVRYRAVVQKIKDSSMGFFAKVMDEDDIAVTDVDGASVAGFGEAGQTLVITLDCTWPLLTPLVSPFFPEGDYNTVGATMRTRLSESMNSARFSMPNKSRGLAAPEIVIVGPIFLLLMFGVFELSRAIQGHNIVVNVSREGANLASRSMKETPQEIMGALAMTAHPLKMDEYGLIYITVVVGKEGASPFVLEQHMWTESGYAEPSRVWAGCTSWTDGACNVPNRAPPAMVPLALDDGETVYVVEVFYDYQNVTSYVISDGPVLYSLALL